MAWNKLDRVMAALSGEIPDRTPIFEYMINDSVFEHYLGRSLIPGEREAIIKGCSKCLDVCHPMSTVYEPHEEILTDGTRRVYERWMAWNIAPKRDINEMAKSIKKEIEQLEGRVITKEDLAKWKEDEARYKAWAEDMVYISVSSSASILPGNIEESAYLFADYPDLCKKWNKTANLANLEWLDAISTGCLAPVAIIWNDIAIKNTLLYSPALLDELFFPWLNEMVSMLHSKGVKVIFHSDGDVSSVFNQLAASGIDGFNPLEITAGMNVEHFYDKYGKKVALVGGMDAVDDLAFGTPESVLAATKKLIQKAWKKGSFIAASSSGEIDNSMPFENVMAYFEAVWNYNIIL